MKKYLLFGLLLFVIFITSVTINKIFNLAVHFETLTIIYFMILIFLIVVVFPATILLSLIENHAPDAMPSKTWKKNKLKKGSKKTYLTLITALNIFMWILLFIFNMLGFGLIISAVMAGSIISIPSFLIYRKYSIKSNEPKNLKAAFIAFIYLFFAFILMVILLQTLILIPTLY